MLLLKVMTSAAAGVAAIGGTLAVVIAGAAPGEPPRGVVRTTCDAGIAVHHNYVFHRHTEFVADELGEAGLVSLSAR